MFEEFKLRLDTGRRKLNESACVARKFAGPAQKAEILLFNGALYYERHRLDHPTDFGQMRSACALVYV